MGLSSTEVANMALTMIGAAGQITSLDDSSKEARICKMHYEQSRKSLLRLHPWNFAEARVTLSPLDETPTFGWTYAMQLPGDCLRILDVDDGEAEYKIEGRKMLIDSNSADLRYIRDIQDFEEPLFIEALVAFLAFKISYAITQSDTVRDVMFKAYQQVLAKARFVDATEDPAKLQGANQFIDSRSGGAQFVRDPQT